MGLIVRRVRDPGFFDQLKKVQRGPDADTTICRGPDHPHGGVRGALTRAGDEHGAVCLTLGRVSGKTRCGMDEGGRPNGQYGRPRTVLPFLR